MLIAEDVVTTGLSTRECIACVRGRGRRGRGGRLPDRPQRRAPSGWTCPLVALARLELPVYPADRLPPELAAQPATKPGSRATAAAGLRAGAGRPDEQRSGQAAMARAIMAP